jgi:hypothetical protein
MRLVSCREELVMIWFQEKDQFDRGWFDCLSVENQVRFQSPPMIRGE